MSSAIDIDDITSAQRLLATRLLRTRWEWRARRLLQQGIRDAHVNLNEAREMLTEWLGSREERKRRAAEAREL